MIRQKLRDSACKVAEAIRQQSLLQSDIDEDWRLFVESRGGPFGCMHKPTNCLQNEPPFHPLPSTQFFFFHAEEGLRYLFICQVCYIKKCIKGRFQIPLSDDLLLYEFNHHWFISCKVCFISKLFLFHAQYLLFQFLITKSITIFGTNTI